MNHSSDTIYLIIRRKKNYWQNPAITRMSRRLPKLKDGEVAIKLNARIPSSIFDPPQVSLDINESNLIRPTIEAKQ